MSSSQIVPNFATPTCHSSYPLNFLYTLDCNTCFKNLGKALQSISLWKLVRKRGLIMKKILVQVTQFVTSVLLPLHKLATTYSSSLVPKFLVRLRAEPQEFYFGETSYNTDTLHIYINVEQWQLQDFFFRRVSSGGVKNLSRGQLKNKMINFLYIYNFHIIYNNLK